MTSHMVKERVDGIDYVNSKENRMIHAIGVVAQFLTRRATCMAKFLARSA